MNVNEAKNILLPYRPGTADAEDPQIAGALALAQRLPELARWLEQQDAHQAAVRARFRQISVPEGLKQQILSEQPARQLLPRHRPRLAVASALAAVLLMVAVAGVWRLCHPGANSLAAYRSQMIGLAQSGYCLDLLTNSPTEIRSYLAEHRVPSDLVLPAALQTAELVGCTVQGWQQTRVAMVCFRTGRPLPTTHSSDLWLFVVPRTSVQDAPEPGQRRFTTVNGLTTAVWVDGDKVYLLGTAGSESTLQQFL